MGVTNPQAQVWAKNAYTTQHQPLAVGPRDGEFAVIPKKTTLTVEFPIQLDARYLRIYAEGHYQVTAKGLVYTSTGTPTTWSARLSASKDFGVWDLKSLPPMGTLEIRSATPLRVDAAETIKVPEAPQGLCFALGFILIAFLVHRKLRKRKE